MEELGFAKLKYPEMRAELLSYLKGLSDKDYQVSCWVNRKCPCGVMHDEFDYVIHFLFDDTVLSKDPEKLIGYCLQDTIEARAVKAVCDALDSLLKTHGTGLSDAQYIELPEWGGVMSEALYALSVLAPVPPLSSPN